MPLLIDPGFEYDSSEMAGDFQPYRSRVGDSAGGELALAILNEPTPGCLVTSVVVFSRWTDLALTGASFNDPTTRDPVFTPAVIAELLLDDSRRYALRAAHRGGGVALDVFEGMHHVFQRDAGSLETADLALDLTARFVTDHWFEPARTGNLTCRAVPLPPAILRHYGASVVRSRDAAPPRGTVILLPGYGIGKLSMLPWALLPGRAGYQTILVDLRAQGQSTGRHVTYGALESRDFVQLVAALRKTGLIRDRLGLLGDSMGAATALLAAPHIPDLAAVVAISPYGRATTVIRRYARAAYWYARFIPSASWRAAERKAGRIAGVHLAKAAPINAVPRIRAPVLYLQGGRDHGVSLEAARRLAARTPDSRLLIYPKLGHLQFSTGFAQLARPVIDWYNRYVGRDRQHVALAGKRPKMPPPASFHICVHL